MGATTILAAAGAVAFSANAQSVSAHARIPDQEISAATRSYDIPPGLVSTALNRLADESGVRIIYDAALTRSLTTPGLKGRHTLPGALALLLAGTGLKYEVSQDGRSALILLAQAGGAANDAVPLGATALPTIEVGAAQPTSGQGTPSDQGQGGAAATSGDQSSGGAGGGAGGYGGAGAAQDPYNKSYVLENASTGTKTNTPVMETPVNVQTISQQVLQDQQATSLGTALQNVSGVFLDNGTANGTTNALVSNGIIIRGFETTSYFRDGFRVDSSSGASVHVDQLQFANIAALEVLKGPGAILYGFTDPGGIINIVTKQPLDAPYYAVDARFGSLADYRTSIDTTGPLNADKSLLYRFNMSYENNGAPYGSIIDRTGSQSIFVAPVVKWNIDEATWVKLEAEYGQQHALSYYFPWDPNVNGVLVNLPRSANYGINSPYTTDDLFAALSWSHRFDKDWSIKQQVAYYGNNYYTNGANGEFPVGPVNNPFPIVTGGHIGDVFRSTTYSTNVDILGHINTLGLEHTLLLGGDYYRLTGFSQLIFAGEGATALLNPGLAFAVNSCVPPFGITGPCAPFNTSFEQDTAGLYLQDQIKLPYDFFFLTGARYQYIKQLSNGYGFGPDYEGETLPSSSQALTPRFGLLWRPKEWVSFYGNYTESFSPNSGVMYPGLPLPPTSAESWEAGLKLEFFDKKLRFGADYFELVKTNTPYQDPDLAHNCGGGPGSCSLVAGATRSNGTEVDVNGEILPGLSVTANYSNIDARFATVSPIYTSVGGPARGERFPGVPRNAANIFTTYEFQKDSVLNGLKIGAGYHYYGSIPVGDYVNPPWVWRLIPSYGTVDLMAAYSWRYAGSKMTAQLNVTNLLDRTYYTGISNQGLVIAGPQNNSYRTYGAPLAVLGSLRAELDEGAAPAPWLLPVPTTGPSQPSFGWTGLYVGGQAGYGWGDNDGSLNWATAQGQVGPGPAGSQIGSGAQGFIGGAHLGYNYQLDQWVLGVEGSVDGTTLNKEILDTQPNLIADPYQEFGVGAEFTGRARTGVQGSLRARGGYAFGRLLPYVTGGLAVGSFNTDTQMVGADPLYAGGMLSGAIPFAASGTKSAMRVGWTLGAGVEYALNNHWSLLGEWRYTDFGYLGNFADPSSVGAIFALNRHLDQQQVQVGFSYRLFADPEPAVAPAIVKGPALAGHVASKPAPQPPFTPVWDGFYLGAQVGYGWGLNDGSITYATPEGLAGQSALGSSAAFVGGGTTSNGDAIGPMGGVHFGYNRQYGQWVTGLESSVDPTVMNRNLAISVPDLAADPMGTKGIAATATGSIWSQIQASLRARAGYALDRMLIYGTAGVAFGEFASTFQLYGIDNTTLAPFYAANEHSALRVGWTVGAGVEFAVNPHWSVRGEYRYTDFGQLGDIPAPTSMGAFYTADRHLDQQQVEVGVSYHFNGGATAPLETAVAGGLPSIKGPLSVPSWTPAWSGFYAGANVGGTFWVNATTHAVGADLFDDNAPAAAGGASASSASGRAQASYAHLIGGGQFGYNHQFEGKVVAGLETDIQGVPSSSDGISFTSSAVDPNGSATTMTTFGLFRHSLDYLGTVRGRLGLLATPSLLVYGGGGLAYGGVNFSTTYSSVDAAGFYGVGTGSSSYSNARLGWTGVGGLEWMFAPRWSAKLEYAFYDLGTATTHTVVVGPNTTTGATGYAYAASTSLRFNSNLVRAGLNYHFNWEDALPVVAKY